MGGRVRRVATAALLGLLLAGCATFPEQGPREWHEKLEGAGELGGPPVIPEPTPPPPSSPEPGEQGQDGGAPPPPSGCVDPDPQVIATCLDPVGAIAVLPNAVSALVGEQRTGRVLRVEQGRDPQPVATIPVDAAGGGLTGLVLSPSYVEDQLAYAYVSTREDNRVVRLAAGEPAEPVLTGIPRGATGNGGALAVGPDGSLLVATGNAGQDNPAPDSLAGKILRIDTQGRPAKGNPDPTSPVLSSGLQSPGGMCVDAKRGTVWATDRRADGDALHLVAPGPLPAPAWRWPEKPGVTGCATVDGLVSVAQSGAQALFVLEADADNIFVGTPQQMLQKTYGRLSTATTGPDGVTWLGTANKAGGSPVPSDDRVIRIQVAAAGGDNRQ